VINFRFPQLRQADTLCPCLPTVLIFSSNIMIPELTMQRLPSRDSKVRKYKIGDLRKAVLGVLAESYYELATMFKLLDEVEKNSAEGSVLLEAIAFRWTRECMKEVLKNEVGSLSKS
jgi:hypothetical protein